MWRTLNEFLPSGVFLISYVFINEMVNHYKQIICRVKTISELQHLLTELRNFLQILRFNFLYVNI